MSWLKAVMSKTDDRVRANLIESLWNRKEPEIELVLRQAAKDHNPRVAANAVYGLYLLNLPDWMEGLERLIGSNSPAGRTSGIWVLKASGAPCAQAKLKLLIRDADAEVRHAAFEALIHLRENGPRKTPAMAAAG
jgi:HEAT repeat protein